MNHFVIPGLFIENTVNERKFKVKDEGGKRIPDNVEHPLFTFRGDTVILISFKLPVKYGKV